MGLLDDFIPVDGMSRYGSKKLGMWLFVASDSATFAAMLACYGYLRMANPHWSEPFSLSPEIQTTTVMTLILIASSFTMLLAVRSMQDGSRSRTLRWLVATICCGAGFIVMHASEWRHLIVEKNIVPSTNLFGATFYALTGLHMLHVACGVIYLSVLAAGIARGKFNTEDVETGGIYWYFVDLVWMVIFPLVYLSSMIGSMRG